MKKLAVLSLSAVLAAFLSQASPMLAGSFTVATGPTFTPDGAFTNNTISLDTTVGSELVRVHGGATIDPTVGAQATIALTGGYSADAGDILSAAFSFVVDNSIVAAVPYTISGTVVVPIPVRCHLPLLGHWNQACTNTREQSASRKPHSRRRHPELGLPC